MRPQEEILSNRRLRDVRHNPLFPAECEVYYGVIRIGRWIGSVVFGRNEDGWEHVSVSPFNSGITPSWRDMCEVKDIFWDEEETVIQFHPPKSTYVNMMPNCLHLNRPKDGVLYEGLLRRCRAQ